jgi:hypothetical protein
MHTLLAAHRRVLCHLPMALGHLRVLSNGLRFFFFFGSRLRSRFSTPAYATILALSTSVGYLAVGEVFTAGFVTSGRGEVDSCSWTALLQHHSIHFSYTSHAGSSQTSSVQRSPSTSLSETYKRCDRLPAMIINLYLASIVHILTLLFCRR